MPYEKDPLSKSEINILKKWIDQGAVWDTHWSYLPVQKPSIPDKFSKAHLHIQSWAKNEIDHFIYEKITENDLNPSQRPLKRYSVRRLSLDLIGLPVSEALVGKLSSDGK
jgi:hypothetical protein